MTLSLPLSQQLSAARHYNFHGLPITVTADVPHVSDAVNDRVRQFAVETAESDAFQIRYEIASEKPEAPSGRVRTLFENDRARITYACDENALFAMIDEEVSVRCSYAERRALVSVQPSALGMVRQCSHPAFTIALTELMKPSGTFALHAAGVSLNGQCALIAGDSGAGKSTLAVTLLLAGYGFLGDDTVFLRRQGQDVEALAFPDEIDVTDRTLDLIPSLRDHLQPPKPGDWPKRQVWPESLRPSPLVRQGIPKVLVFPRVAHRDASGISLLAPEEAFVELLNQVVLSDPDSSRENVAIIAQLVVQAKCYRLETGLDLDRIPQVIADLF